ncbi:glutaredoxin [Streptomyces roseochromogenus]|nr:glutaredoxin [Streptomyces roseochromogenus]
MSANDRIQEHIAAHTVVLFLKGSPSAPADGQSAKAVQAVQAVQGCGEGFTHVDVLQGPEIGAALAEVPQLWVAGELVGGADTVAAQFADGELQTLIKGAVAKAADRA